MVIMYENGIMKVINPSGVIDEYNMSTLLEYKVILDAMQNSLDLQQQAIDIYIAGCQTSINKIED